MPNLPLPALTGEKVVTRISLNPSAAARSLLLVIGLILALSAPHAALAAKSASTVCADVAKTAQRVLWDQVREAANDSFCHKPWVQRTEGEFLACTGINKSIKFSNKLRDRWNRFFDRAGSEWATWGPRGIAEPWESGTIRAGFKRTFFGVGMAQSVATVEVDKRGGRSSASITVCELDQQGRVVGTHRRNFRKGKAIPSPRTVEIRSGDDTRILAVVIDTPAGTKSFQYRAKLDNNPIRNNIGAIKGIADLHVHQFAELAFGARMLWGEHDGPAATALPPDVISTRTPDNIGEALGQLGNLDANLLMWQALNLPDEDGNVRTDEGFLDIPTAGFPSFESWPHHADRGHQQAHTDWLHQAVIRNRPQHENLSLMVASIVHNDVLCKVYKAFDPNGNIAERNNRGEITGWRSAPWKCEDDESVKLQLDAAHALERKYSWYRIALNPWHARQIIADGDLAVVLALETDKVLSSDGGKYGNWENTLDFYRAKGLSTLQVVHESNSFFCGAALHRDMMQPLQALHFPIRSIANLTKGDGTFDLVDSGPRRGHNRIGITTDGKRLIDAMVARHMPIDLAHGSTRCREDIIARVPQQYGLFDSHAKFGQLLQTAGADWEALVRQGRMKEQKINRAFPPFSVAQREKTFVIGEDMVPLYRDHKVLIGLRTASIDVDTAPPARGDARNPAYTNSCPGSAQSFAQTVKFAHDQKLLFAYGTDFNTGVSQLGPRFNRPGGPNIRCFAARDDIKLADRTTRGFGPQPALPARANQVAPIATTNYYFDGLATIGWLPELTNDLRAMRVPGANELTQGAERYLQMWERAYDHGTTNPDITPETGSGTGGCKTTEDCRDGEFCSTPVIGQHVCLPEAAAPINADCSSDRQCATGRCSSIDGTGGSCVCADDDHCLGNQYCDRGWLTVGKNQCVARKAYGAGCSRDEQCGTGRVCQGKPLGKCITPNSVGIAGRCIKDQECTTGSCDKDGRCQCRADNDCNGNQYCDKGWLTVGKNQCVAFKAYGANCSRDDQCRSPSICKGWPAGKCITEDSLNLGARCIKDAECKTGSCDKDGRCQCKKSSDCGSGRYCDTGTVGIGKNSCKRSKGRNETCSANKQCGAGLSCKGLVGFKKCKS